MNMSKEYHKEWRLKNKDKVQASKERYFNKIGDERKWMEFEARLKRKYSLSVYDYSYLRYIKQENRCYICDCTLLDTKGKKFTSEDAVVDHCHETGRVRGVACGFCNTLEGYIKKDKHKVLACIKRFV